MRSATRSSLIMSTSVCPSTYSEWLRISRPFGIEVGLTVELDDASGDLVRVTLLFVGVLEKLSGHCLGVFCAVLFRTAP